MIRLFTTALALAGISSAIAADAPALLISADGKENKVSVVSASDSQIVYKSKAGESKVDRSKVKTVFFKQPRDFAQALTAFNGENYADALIQFEEVQAAFADVAKLPQNYSTLAGFYVLECHRLMGNWGKLAAAKDKYSPGQLAREDHKKQLELYPLWLAAHAKDWARLSRLTAEVIPAIEVNSFRAQAAYLKGLALANSDQPIQALNAYAQAFTTDYGSSLEVVKMAYYKSFDVYLADEQVQTALKVAGTADERVNTVGHQRLLEAGALTKLYDLNFGDKKPLKTEYAVFKKFAAAS